MWQDLLSLIEFCGKRESARAAARAVHGAEDVLLLLLVEIGAFEHRHRLLLEQIVQREIAVFDPIPFFLRPLVSARAGWPCGGSWSRFDRGWAVGLPGLPAHMRTTLIMRPKSP